jgi:hypothetical protein
MKGRASFLKKKQNFLNWAVPLQRHRPSFEDVFAPLFSKRLLSS